MTVSHLSDTPTIGPLPSIMTAEEVALELKISTRQLRRLLVRKGDHAPRPSFRIGESARWLGEEVMAWAKRRAAASRGDG